MTRIEAFLVVGLIDCLLFACNAHAACMSLSDAKKIAADSHGKLTPMSPAQWQFLRGAFAFAPNTPLRVPYGDRAILITSAERETALAFFLDGDKACDLIVMRQGEVDVLTNIGAVVHAPKVAPIAPIPTPTPTPSPNDERLKL